VDRLEVVNKKWVRVVLKNSEQVKQVHTIFLNYFEQFKLIELEHCVKKLPWFSIGSVDAFERNLESAQSELGLDTMNNNYVPVLYRDEADM
jgi:AFG3 family protein